MDRLVATGPLDGIRAVVCENLSLTPLPAPATIALRGKASNLDTLLPPPGLPGPNRVNDYGSCRLLWLRPGGWLLVGEDLAPIWPARLSEAAGDGLCRLIDMGHALAAIRIEGSCARTLLAKGTPLDLRPHRFGRGQCARSWCAGFHVLIEPRGEGFDLYVDSSLAQALWDWLVDAAVEFGGSV